MPYTKHVKFHKFDYNVCDFYMIDNHIYPF
jgi:hypothetical protein